jgi:hypothetical protein
MGRQRDGGIIAHCGTLFQCHVAAPLDRPFIVLCEEQGAHEVGNGIVIGQDADHAPAALNFAVQAFKRMVLCRLVRCCGGNDTSASTSSSAVPISLAGFVSWSATLRHCP